MAKILVIDDEKIIRERLSNLLELDEYKTFIAENGQQGLDVFAKENPEIVLVDIKMPGMDGLEVLKRIKEQSKKTEVIIITGHGGIESSIQALRDGAFDYITKPVEYDELEISVKKALEKQEMQIKLNEYVHNLEVSNEYVDNILKSMNDGLLVVGADCTIKTVNQAALDLLGHNEEEMFGNQVSEFFPEEKMFCSIEEKGRLLGKGSINDYDSACITKTGEKIPVSLSCSVMRKVKSEEPLGMVIVVRDMRESRLMKELQKSYEELKQTQAQLVQSGKMAAIGQFAAGIAHEIRNPLTSITMNTAFLLDELKDNEKAIKKLKRIETEADRSSGVIKSLLSFSTQTKAERTVTADVNRLVEDTLVPFEHQISLANVEVVREFTQELPKVVVNPNEISQVFLNIINNAVDAMSKGGKLVIKTYVENVKEGGQRKTDNLKRGQKAVCIEFSDTGQGMSREDVGKLFTAFHTTKAPGKGTGLGLFISHGIVERHSGEIEVKSELGKGTSFVIKLPT